MKLVFIIFSRKKHILLNSLQQNMITTATINGMAKATDIPTHFKTSPEKNNGTIKHIKKVY